PFGACRSGCSTSPTSLSPGRVQRWPRQVGSPRGENPRRRRENQSVGQRESDPPTDAIDGSVVRKNHVNEHAFSIQADARPAPKFSTKEDVLSRQHGSRKTPVRMKVQG